MIYVCGECGEICNIVHIPLGKSRSEYWGCPKWTMEYDSVTDCCKSQRFDEYKYEEDVPE